jgi:hypothetical protein
MARKPSTIPAEVVAFGDALRTDGAGLVPELVKPLAQIAERLIRTDGPDAARLARMWNHFMRQQRQPRLPGLFAALGCAVPRESTRDRALSFLQAVQSAIITAELSNQLDPAIDDQARRIRRDQARRIRKAGASLARMLRAAGVGDIDCARPALGLLQPSPSRTDTPGAAEVIETLTERAANCLAPPMRDRRAGSPEARAFVRALAMELRIAFGRGLPSVIATACNAMTGTSYRAQDVNEILGRVPLWQWLKSKDSPD